MHAITVDLERSVVTVSTDQDVRSYPLDAAEAFDAVTSAWLRCGWAARYTYTFTWLGRPVIQLPDDLIKVQEALFEVRPDVIVETGVAHGGSLVYYAGICKLLGHGRVIGVDKDIRPPNRRAIEEHELAAFITLVEGDSVDSGVVEEVAQSIAPDERAFVILDSDHSLDHVEAELESYSPLVAVGSYIVVADGIMKTLVGTPGASDEWSWNNPLDAVSSFLGRHPEFEAVTPPRSFDESVGVGASVTYWPGGWLRRTR